MYALWIGNIAVYFSAPLPLFVHVLASTIAIHMAFTIWHEAAHATIFDDKRANDIAGVIAMFPYMSPFFMQKWIHIQHHRKLNQPGDPNLIYLDGSFPTVPLRYGRALAYAKKVVTSDARTPGQKRSDNVSIATVAAIWVIAALAGFGLDLIVLWGLPFVLAKGIMDWYINYMPHIGLPADKFLGTRIIESSWLTPLILCHNYHAIHHLWPAIPWHEYREVYRRHLDYLRSHRVPIVHSVVGYKKASLAPAMLQPET